MKVATKLLAVLSAVVLSAASVGAQEAAQRQGGQGRRALPGVGAPLDDTAVAPAEIQRMFDAYALVQAQDQLRLGDDLYARFLIRYKALQDIRRRSLQEHTRLLADLRRLLTQQQPDEAQLKARMQALQDAETRADADIKKAQEAIDQLLDVKQQASFRVFEEQMERRKIELITRARQTPRVRPQQ